MLSAGRMMQSVLITYFVLSPESGETVGFIVKQEVNKKQSISRLSL